MKANYDGHGKHYITANGYLGTFSQLAHQGNYGKNNQYGILPSVWNTLLPRQDFTEVTARLSKYKAL